MKQTFFYFANTSKISSFFPFFFLIYLFISFSVYWVMKVFGAVSKWGSILCWIVGGGDQHSGSGI
ncbi:hypothetical protein L211DRAFT_492267 [Terfezia boudieri ATCC MYA-4762]|uniref:Uncharacterized protein n=1 Tax=Terfezia boudieri ATCC MYA-4762 TaxID=1051890 RepID=A0A3N4LD25_9PEZI|nr:hypothetical protein L211DRAFT_492267 [Terfezia boudieri ATCC MYA-4762]